MGGVGGKGGERAGGPAGRGFNCRRTVRLRTPVSQGGYPFEAKKGFECGALEGVPVLTT